MEIPVMTGEQIRQQVRNQIADQPVWQLPNWQRFVELVRPDLSYGVYQEESDDTAKIVCAPIKSGRAIGIQYSDDRAQTFTLDSLDLSPDDVHVTNIDETIEKLLEGTHNEH